MTYTLSKPDRILRGEIHLDGSKSISNRALVIQALCGEHFEIKKLSTSNDTRLMQQLLSDADHDLLDAGAAGTTFRFLTAYLATRPGTQTLTGSPRMKQRPIGALVDALRTLGARIEYLEQEGFPPLRIHSPENLGDVKTVAVPVGTSSQFLSALLLIAPVLPNGLELRLEGEPVSRPYLDMTLQIMAYFGAKHTWEENIICVSPQPYQARDITVEADWTAASYFYALAAFSEHCDLRLHGLREDSWQGDAAIARMMEGFGVETIFHDQQVHLSKVPGALPFFEQDFLPCPDLAQTLAVVCGGLGTQGLFSGLSTLRIKETDRIAAMQHELAKVHVFLSKLPPRFSKKSDREYFMVEGKANLTGSPTFDTYDDHRMAMAFAPLALLGEVKIAEPGVVGKSYPAFWEDFAKLGFRIEEAA